jgi:hypothetical protein
MSNYNKLVIVYNSDSYDPWEIYKFDPQIGAYTRSLKAFKTREKAEVYVIKKDTLRKAREDDNYGRLMEGS